jgi:anti-sigma regulatory factor (Ser/Thr protein kinase)
MKSVQSFPHSTRSVREARTFATEQLCDLNPDTRADVSLLVSELATNAIRHAATGFQVSVDRDADDIRIGVTDTGDGVPMLGPSSSDLNPKVGRGLQLVDRISNSWGVDNNAPHRKTVWFTVHSTTLH